MIHRILPLAAIGALALALGAASPAAPSLDHLTPADTALLHFASGQWQFDVVTNGQAATMRICFDAALTERFVDMGRLAGLVSCNKAVVKKTSDGFTLHSVCTAVRGQTATTDVARHVTDADHFTQRSTVVWIANSPDPSPTEVSDTRAVRLGACPSSAEAGDMDMAGSDVKLNLNVLMQPAQ